jgi:2,3-bisphosphoglycerate-dependent phosphoglycerate mutase
MLTSRSWPAQIFLIRHGESAGNVARDHAEANGLAEIQIQGRDVDVPLSPLGERQARALGQWFASLEQPPTVVLTSPYVRAMQTAALLSSEIPAAPRGPLADERLREKEFGSFNRLTKAGIVAKFPAEAALRSELGKFYYRPPGGESWCDVILRLRSVLDDLQLRHRGERVVIVAHQVIVLCFRYLLEELSEQQILDIDREKDVANCSVTSYVARGEVLAIERYNFVSPVAEAGEKVTTAPDPKAAR